MTKGFDISHTNSIQWDKVSSDMQFVYCKATQGVTFKDPLFNQYWQYLKSTSLFRGAYHFLSIEGTAQQQADNFLSCGIDFSKPNVLPPMLDVEDQIPASLNQLILANRNKFIQLITDWISIVENATGRKVVLYSYKSFFAEYMDNHAWPDCYLWLAAYQKSVPGLPKGYNNWDFWQYSEYGTVSGEATGGEIDLDYFNGTIEQLAKL
ncbi:MAG: glycoside hydrolase family 25 protein [Mucilaginibacter sp.]